MKPLIAILITFSLLGCKQEYSSRKVNDEIIYDAKESDIRMNQAIENAKNTLDSFTKVLNSHDGKYSDFALKMSFPTEGGHEHIWLNNIELKNGIYIGTINNIPADTDAVKLGDTVQIINDRISDWMYSEHGKLRGGFTILAIRNTLEKEDLKEFDSLVGLEIE